jgi:hypothetical protein
MMARQDEGSFVPPSTLGVSRLRTRADETAIRPKGIRGFLRSRMESANSLSVPDHLVRLWEALDKPAPRNGHLANLVTAS